MGATAPAQARITLDLENDRDLSGLVDQLVACMLHPNSSRAMRGAALEGLNLMSTRSGLAPAEIVGQRWQTGPVQLRPTSLFLTTSSQFSVRCYLLADC